MELAHVETFLVLAQELHFGRTAQRLNVSQSRVSKLVAALEREIGGLLFDRTSRRVRLTPLGDRLRERLEPAYGALLDAVRSTRAAAREPVGTLRIACTITTGGAALGELMNRFHARFPQIEVTVDEVAFTQDTYEVVRSGAFDVLVNWRTGAAGPGITEGPSIDRQGRVAAMSAHHPLARRASVAVGEIDNWGTAPTVPAYVLDLLMPPVLPDGTRPGRVAIGFASLSEYFMQVSLGKVVHATLTSLQEISTRRDIVYVPIRNLPPIELCVIWCTSHENTLIRALAAVANELSRELTRRDGALPTRGTDQP